jgi:hypothetical protein
VGYIARRFPLLLSAKMEEQRAQQKERRKERVRKRAIPKASARATNAPEGKRQRFLPQPK